MISAFVKFLYPLEVELLVTDLKSLYLILRVTVRPILLYPYQEEELVLHINS